MISPNDYTYIASRLGVARDDASDAKIQMWLMKNNLINSNIDDKNTNKLLLKNIIDSVYLLITENYIGADKQMKSFLTALQNHIVKKYNTVDNFLSSNNIMVSQSFADLSSEIGFSISIENIE